jgi:hypothetical protein
MRARLERHGTPPRPGEIIAAFDAEARAAATQAKTEAVAIARHGAPGSFGGSNMTGSVRRTLSGYLVEVGIRAKVRWRAKFPEGGTKGPIRRKKRGADGRPLPFKIGDRYVEQVSGQRAQHFMARNRPLALAAVERVFRARGDRAARRARR